MDFNNMLMHNLGALEEIPGFGKNGLVRVPKNVRNKLCDRGKFVGMNSVGIEFQFVTDAYNIDIYLSAQKPEFASLGSVRIYRGNFLYKILELEPGIVHMFRLNLPETFPNANEKMLHKNGFSPNVWRIVCDRASVIFHGINTYGYDVRQPKKEELPPLNWLAYGSSITNSNLDGYAHIAAQNLGIQVQNMGFSGSCQIEKELVDYMLDERAFDFMSCELGINMVDWFEPDVFCRRAGYLIDRLVEMKKPAIIISIFPNSKTDGYTNYKEERKLKETAFNEILEELTKKANLKTIQFIRGADILTDINGLSADLIHPTAYGHAVMGMNLAQKTEKFLCETELMNF